MNKIIRTIYTFVLEPRYLQKAESNFWPFKNLEFSSLNLKQFIPYVKQKLSWKLMNTGESTILNWGTAAGKTEATLYPLLNQILGTGSHCLVLYPMKALSQDQENRFRNLCYNLKILIERFDSSVPPEVKEKIKENPGDMLIITPDSLLDTLITTDRKDWFNYLMYTPYIWVDEFHALSGTLGTALSYLIRIMSVKNPALKIYLTTATLPNAHEISNLFSQKPKVIKESGKRGKIFFHICPKSELDEIIDLIIDDPRQFLIFIENKKKIKKIMKDRNLFENNIDQYHGDLPDSDRNLILKQFREKEIRGLLCTSALSLGIDIPSVKNLVIYGLPRSFSQLFQELGRGMRDPDSWGNVFLILDEDNLIDTYYSTNYNELEGEIRRYTSEPMIIDLLNDRILRGMVLFAIKVGLTTRDDLKQVFPEALGSSKLVPTLVWLTIKGYISKFKEKYVYHGDVSDRYLINFALNLRPGFPQYNVLSYMEGEAEEIGKISMEKIPRMACNGNYYTDGLICYQIKEIDTIRREIHVEKVQSQYYSSNEVYTEVLMGREIKFRDIGGIKLRLADFRVSIKPSTIINRKKLSNGRYKKETFDPNRFGKVFKVEFETRGLIIDLNFEHDRIKNMDEFTLYQLAKILLRNAVLLINVSESEVDCYQEQNKNLIYYLDRGGPTGISMQLFEKFESIWKKTRTILESCDCPTGGCSKCSIPIRASYLMPNLLSGDIFRKNEILEILNGCFK